MRDYSKPPPKQRTTRPSTGGGLWIGLFSGLLVGVAASAGFYWFKLRPPVESPASPKAVLPQSQRDELPSKEAPPANPNAYTFYDELKNFSVKIPDKETEAHRDLKPSPQTLPGSYIIQAGSYPTEAEADRKRAQLALLGVEAHIQAVVYENEKYYRVKIGPIQNLDQLNSIRERLLKGHVDTTMTRVSD